MQPKTFSLLPSLNTMLFGERSDILRHLQVPRCVRIRARLSGQGFIHLQGFIYTSSSYAQVIRKIH